MGQPLRSAYRKAAKGKRGRVAAAAFEYRLEDNLLQLQEELADGDIPARSLRQLYHPRTKAPPDQRRALSGSGCAPCSVPRHRTGLRAQLHRPFLRQPRGQRHASRAGHVPAVGADAIRYVLPCDVRQFFPSIDHSILQRTLNRRIQDGGMRRLIALSWTAASAC